MTQKRFADERWFGGAVEINRTSSSSATRYVHPEEARIYSIHSDAFPTHDKYRMPKDVRGERLGLFCVVANYTTGQTIDVQDKDGNAIVSVPTGYSAMIILEDSTTAAGTWSGLLAPTNGKAVLS